MKFGSMEVKGSSYISGVPVSQVVLVLAGFQRDELSPYWVRNGVIPLDELQKQVFPFAKFSPAAAATDGNVATGIIAWDDSRNNSALSALLSLLPTSSSSAAAAATAAATSLSLPSALLRTDLAAAGAFRSLPISPMLPVPAVVLSPNVAGMQEESDMRPGLRSVAEVMQEYELA